MKTYKKQQKPTKTTKTNKNKHDIETGSQDRVGFCTALAAGFEKNVGGLEKLLVV